MTEEKKPAEEGTRPQREKDSPAVEVEEKRGPVDHAIDKAREMGLMDRANDLVEKAIYKVSGNR